LRAECIQSSYLVIELDARIIDQREEIGELVYISIGLS
jgi:hypothetical protein